jgi:Na+:H+ antiporter, NhaA family
MTHPKTTSLKKKLDSFLHSNQSIGITLLVCTLISLLLANWQFSTKAYTGLWNLSFDGTLAHHAHLFFLSLPNSPSLVINDFFMAIFFFLAGMEIKRELVTGELSSVKKSLLPIFAAIGGMLVPALLFAMIARGSSYMPGWAIPTATDIAFTLGVASLLGKRVPAALKVFITALAIIDDLGAILVIAIFYGGSLHWLYLLGAAVIAVIIHQLNKRKIAFGWPHFLLGLVLWYCMFNSGIHATVAGVVFAMLVPVPLLPSFEKAFHTPVYFIILPIFSLANTAIVFPADPIHSLSGPLSLGIIAGLVLGKPLGIFLACYFLISKKWAQLPNGVNWHKLIGAGMLAGIGFTMSIFISALAFTDAATEDIAKMSVLVASLLAMVLGYGWLYAEKRHIKSIEID